MQNMSRRNLLLAATTFALAVPVAQAQEFPSRSISLVVPFAAGGATDVTARRLAEGMAAVLGVPVVVDNKPSAGGFVAATQVANAPKDGYTLLFTGTNAMSLNPLVYRKLPYRPEDLLPISTVSRQAFAVNANLSVPVGSVAEFVAYAKTKPEGVAFGTVGVGTTSHILAEWIGQSLGINIRTVPYKGTSQSTVDLVGGRIDIQIDVVSTGVSMHKSGKTRLLAAMGRERSILPQGVGNFADAGYPDLVAYSEVGVFAPRGIQDAVLNKIHATIVKVVQQPEFAGKLAANGEIAATSGSPAEYAARISSENARWAPVVRRVNLNLD
jgi:tripartite-type tricarboxylate transporter receptor subunit TctC